MPSLETILPVVAVLFGASLVGSTVGFGIGLISMPLLALFLDMKTATPLVGMVGLTVSFCIFARHWREVDFRGAAHLVAASLAGIPIGLFVLRGTHDTALKIALACVILLFSAYRLASPSILKLETNSTAPIFGFFGGILSAAYNTSGPPVIIFGTLRGWTPETFRATLQGFFIPVGVLTLAGHAAAGLWTGTVLKLYLLALAPLLLTVVIGTVLNRAIPKGKFDSLVYVLLLGIGVLLLVRTLLSLGAS